MKINLGCGKDILEDYTNADVSDKVGADVVFDMEQKWPFEDSSVDEIYAKNSLTQISSPKKFAFVMQEMHRVLKPDGGAVIIVPNASHIRSFQDVFDTIRYTKESFTYMDEAHQRYDQYGKHYGYPPFNVSLIREESRELEFELRPVK